MSDVKTVIYRKPSVRQRLWKYRWLYLFLVPAIVWYIIFAYGPIYGLKGIEGSSWVGFKYFEKMWVDKSFWQATRNTLIISGIKLVFVSTSGLVLALLLNEVIHPKYRALSSAVTMLPHFFSWVVIGSLLQELLSPNNGMVNAIIQYLGGTPIYFLGDKNWFLFWVIASDMW